MYKILVPTDFSEFSEYALQYGAFLAKKNKSDLYILHVVRSKNKFKEAEEQLNELLKRKDFVDLKAHLVLENGNVVSKQINKVAKELDVKLIVMGSNGISNVEEMILGSNTENVIVKTKFDVLTIKHEMNSEDLNTILFPSDFKPEAYTIFDSVIKAAKAFNACIHFLKIGKGSGEVQKIESFAEYFKLKEIGINYKVSVDFNKSFEVGILDYALNNDIDLIAMGTHGKGAIKKMLQESTSQNIVRDAFRPVLTMRF